MAQERLQKNNKRREEDGGHSNRYVFSGKIKCGECGSSFVGRFKYMQSGAKLRRWSCGMATKEGTAACDVGKLVRDDDAMEMLKTAIRSLPIDAKAIINNVTTLALDAIQDGETGSGDDPERICFEIKRVQQKKEAVMDSYFSEEITKEDMQAMNRRYDAQIEELHQRQVDAELRQKEKRDSKALRSAIHKDVSAILSGKIESDVFYKTMLESLTVFKDRHMELRLNGLPHVFRFAG